MSCGETAVVMKSNKRFLFSIFLERAVSLVRVQFPIKIEIFLSQL